MEWRTNLHGTHQNISFGFVVFLLFDLVEFLQELQLRLHVAACLVVFVFLRNESSGKTSNASGVKPA